MLTFFWSLFGELGAHLVGRMAMTDFGVLWVAAGFAYVVLTRSLTHGMALTIMLLGCTMLSDTFAYFVGRAVGRHKMAPHISPGKTVEGAVGGLAGAVIAALIVRIYSDRMPTKDAVILGLAIGVAGKWGDLFESTVKRDFRVKDSGRILPGHGGILDRFDSFLFAEFRGLLGVASDCSGVWSEMRRVVVLGATGSIGVQACRSSPPAAICRWSACPATETSALLLEQASSLGVNDSGHRQRGGGGEGRRRPSTRSGRPRRRGRRRPAGARGRSRPGAQRHRGVRRA